MASLSHLVPAGAKALGLLGSETKACETVPILPSRSAIVFCSRVRSVELMLVEPEDGKLKAVTPPALPLKVTAGSMDVPATPDLSSL